MEKYSYIEQGGEKYLSLDLASIEGSSAFNDAIWKDGLGGGEQVAFGGVPFRLMEPGKTRDAPFAVSLPCGCYDEIAFLAICDEAQTRSAPFLTVRLSRGGETRDVTVDLANGFAEEAGRILRGPSGTMHYPLYFLKTKLHPDFSRSSGDLAIEVLPPSSCPSSLVVAAVSLRCSHGMSELEKGFELSFNLDLASLHGYEVLYEVEDVFRVAIRDAKQTPDRFGYDGNGGNYLPFSVSENSCPVIEATLIGPTGKIGIPVGALPCRKKDPRVRIVLNDVAFAIDICGMRDEDFPVDSLLWPGTYKGKAVSSRVSGVEFSFNPPMGPLPPPSPPKEGFNAAYWTPAGHNQWLGDVVLANWDGAIHLFYLIDRRHHNSKAGRGGHWFEHVVSGDLRHWKELPPAVTMDRKTEYIGTGTPFRLGDLYCLAYGLHTTRHCSLERIRELGLPFGGSYAYSTDGVHFTKSGLFFTDDQNPSVFNREDGKLGMGCVRTLQSAESLQGPWKVEVDDAPVFGDCPCPFEWNGWHYIIQGFCTMARSPSGLPGSYEDEVLAGYDIYDGLSVPMVVPWKDNRRIMAGWINHIHGWGGWLCFRELVFGDDGHLGLKWVPEIPLPGVMFTYNCNPDSLFEVKFNSTEGFGNFVLAVDPARKRAAFAAEKDGKYEEIPTLSELAAGYEKEYGPERIRAGRKHRPDDAGDFAIGNIKGLDAPFTVKINNYYDKKSGVTIVDVEIASQRTMVTRRPGRYSIL